MFDYNRTSSALKSYIAAMDQISEIQSREEALNVMDDYFKYGDSGWTMLQFAVESDKNRMNLNAFIEDALDANQNTA